MENICKKKQNVFPRISRSPSSILFSLFFQKELSLHVTFLEFAFAFKFCSFKEAGPAGLAGLHVHEVPQLRAGRDKPSWSKTPDALTAISSATQGLSAAFYQRIRDQNQGLLSPCSDSTLVAHFKCLRGLPMFVRLWCAFWTVQEGLLLLRGLVPCSGSLILGLNCGFRRQQKFLLQKSDNYVSAMIEHQHCQSIFSAPWDIGLVYEQCANLNKPPLAIYHR